MAENETLLDLVNKHVGPAPKPAIGYSMWGIPVNQEAAQAYELEKHKYSLAVAEATRQLAPQVLNPFRGSTLEEVSSYTNRPMRDIASPSQYIEQTREEPSLVPATRMHYTQAGDFPMGTAMVPRAVQLQGPPNLTQPDPLDTGSMRGMVEQYPLGIQHQPERVQLQGPPNPAKPEFYERPGDPLQVTVREPNPHAPSTLPQQLLGVSNVERESRWPRSGGSAVAKQTAVEQLVSAGVPHEAAIATVYGGEPLPGGMKASNLQARTEGREIRNEYAPQEYQDKHANAESFQRYRQNHIDVSNKLLPFREQLMQADARLKSGKLAGDTPDMRMQQERIDLAKKKFDFIAKLLVAQKGEVNDETRELLQEDLAELAGLTGEVGKQGLIQSMFGDKPQPQRVPKTPSGTPSTTPATTKPDDTTNAINELLRSRGVDAAQAQQSGVKYQGKLYKFKDGKWSE